MKRYLLSLLTVLSFGVSATAAEQLGNLLECPAMDMTDGKEKGRSLLDLIKKEIKPELDAFATEGYEIVDGDRLVDVLDKVDSKVRRQALSSVRGSSQRERIRN